MGKHFLQAPTSYLVKRVTNRTLLTLFALHKFIYIYLCTMNIAQVVQTVSEKCLFGKGEPSKKKYILIKNFKHFSPLYKKLRFTKQD